jgi:transcriptional/translational regulatory protein YebC/TACO1
MLSFAIFILFIDAKLKKYQLNIKEELEFERIPTEMKEVTAEQQVEVDKLLEKLEEDEDVTNVFHNMKVRE